MRWCFLLIMILAAVLRFWRLWDMPFMHDETSALVRLYPSLWETIRSGVALQDTHPPGVQVFEWLWTKVFGSSEFAVKLPFVMMSLAAIVLIYRTAMAWGSATTALVVVTLMATLQYTVLYGQLARPYAAGLFTTALFVDQLTRWLAQGQRKHLLWMGVAAVLSAYTHHFALLLVGLMGLSGLFLARPTERKNYLIMGALVVLCYLPNIPIFLKQLNEGGLGGWLAPPDRYWILDHAWWVAHTTWWLAIPLGLLLIGSLVGLLRKHQGEHAGFRSMLFWGITPLLIGLAYSAWRAPVIQHSVLIFSFPYLAIALLMGLGELGKTRILLLCGSLAAIATFTLVNTRQHYALLYNSNYETMLRKGLEAIEEHGPQGVAVLLDAPAPQLDFYMKRWSIAPEALPHIRLRDKGFTPGRLDSLLITLEQPMLVYGQSNGAPNEQLARIQLHYPQIMQRMDLAEGQVFVLGRGSKEPGLNDRRLLTGACPICDPLPGWEIHEGLPWQENDSAEVRYWNYSDREYGVLIALALDSVSTMEQDQIEVVADLYLPSGLLNAGLVLELKDGDSTLFYRSAELMDLSWNGVGHKVSLVVAARTGVPQLRGRATVLRAYLHNREGRPLGLRSMSVHFRKANPVVYGITGPIEGPWIYRPE